MPITVCCMSKKCWWIFDIIFLLMVVALEIASLGVDRWFEQGNSPDTDWEGGLRRPTSDSNFFSDTDTYSDKWDQCNDGSVSGQDGLCEMWHHLWAGGVIYILFETISLFFIAATIFIILLDLCGGTKHLWLSIVFIWNVLAWHFFAFVIWSGLAMMYFKDDCENITWDEGSSQARVCGKEGPAIALACVLFLPFVALIHTLVYCSVRRQTLQESENNKVTIGASEENNHITPGENHEVVNEEEHEHHHRKRKHRHSEEEQEVQGDQA